MNKRLFVALGLFSVALILLLFFPSSNTEKKEEKVKVSVVGEHSFFNTNSVQFKTISFTDTLSTHVVLISYHEPMTEKKHHVIDGWLTSGHIVFFYGKDVEAVRIPEKMGASFEPYEVMGDTPTRYFLYGYGYSKTYKKTMPFFLATNTDDRFTEKITDFLAAQKGF